MTRSRPSKPPAPQLMYATSASAYRLMTSTKARGFRPHQEPQPCATAPCTALANHCPSSLAPRRRLCDLSQLIPSYGFRRSLGHSRLKPLYLNRCATLSRHVRQGYRAHRRSRRPCMLDTTLVCTLARLPHSQNQSLLDAIIGLNA